MHPAYKHLTDRLRIAELTVPQIAGLFAGLMSGLVFALYLSPFSPYLTLCRLDLHRERSRRARCCWRRSTEFDLWLYVQACVGEQLSDGRYAAGPGDGSPGM